MENKPLASLVLDSGGGGGLGYAPPENFGWLNVFPAFWSKN